jgi:hypothetical protein
VRALTAALALGVALVVAPGGALAFHDPDQYGRQAMSGGGARSWFTGSRRFAGYDCALCHTNAPRRVRLELASSPAGLFDTGRYVPQAEYRITVRLAAASLGAGLPADRNAFTAEAVADDGEAAAGTLDAADEQVELVDEGRVVGPSASLASGTEWSFTWIAPPPGSGPAWLHVAAVDGDSDGSSAGDDVATTARRLSELGGVQSPTEAGYEGAGCTAAPGAPRPGLLPMLLLALVPWKSRAVRETYHFCRPGYPFERTGAATSLRSYVGSSLYRASRGSAGFATESSEFRHAGPVKWRPLSAVFARDAGPLEAGAHRCPRPARPPAGFTPARSPARSIPARPTEGRSIRLRARAVPYLQKS